MKHLNEHDVVQADEPSGFVGKIVNGSCDKMIRNVTNNPNCWILSFFEPDVLIELLEA